MAVNIEVIDEIADKLNWPKAVDSLGKRVYAGTWLSGDNDPTLPPVAKAIGFRDDVVLVDVNPARQWEIKTPWIVECRIGTDSGWVRSNEQPSEIEHLDNATDDTNQFQ